MNILVVGKFYLDAFASHIAETLVAMGHDVRRYEPGFHDTGKSSGRIAHWLKQTRSGLYAATDGIPAVRSRRTQALLQTAASAPLDLVIACHDFLWPAEVTELKSRTGAAVALWFPDSLVNFGRGFFMNARFDALFFKDPYIVHVLDGILASPVYYLPECFNPERMRVAQTESTQEYECDITTAGNLHSYRAAVFGHLVGYQIKLWGPTPPLWLDSPAVIGMHRGRPVVNEEKALAFRSARIVVNTLHYGEIWGLNARAFETAGAGGFQLVDWRPGLSQLFKDEVELVSFRGISDLKRRIDYWLPLDDERRAVADAGMRRAYQEHTYRHRLGLLLDTVAGRARGFPVPAVGY